MGLRDAPKRLLAAMMPLVLLVGAAGVVRAADGEFVANGTFDTDLAGWTVPATTGCGNTQWYAAGNPGGSAWLNACGEALSDPSIEQDLTGLVIGEEYELTGEYASVATGFGDPSKPDAFEVELDGNVILSLGRPSPIASTWTAFSVTFTATATSHTIAFYAERDGDDSDFAIDNISVIGEADAGGTPTPEPTQAPSVTVPPTDGIAAPASPGGIAVEIATVLVALGVLLAVAFGVKGRSARRPTR